MTGNSIVFGKERKDSLKRVNHIVNRRQTTEIMVKKNIEMATR
jgi:hypothetical protein